MFVYGSGEGRIDIQSHLLFVYGSVREGLTSRFTCCLYMVLWGEDWHSDSLVACIWRRERWPTDSHRCTCCLYIILWEKMWYTDSPRSTCWLYIFLWGVTYRFLLMYMLFVYYSLRWGERWYTDSLRSTSCLYIILWGVAYRFTDMLFVYGSVREGVMFRFSFLFFVYGYVRGGVAFRFSQMYMFLFMVLCGTVCALSIAIVLY